MRALLVVAMWASTASGCACGAVSHPPDGGALDGGALDGGADATVLDTTPDVPLLDAPVPDVPPFDAPCIESSTVMPSGTVLGSGAERFTEAEFEPTDCEGTTSVSLRLYEAGMPFDGDGLSVAWLDASSLSGPEPVRGLDVPVTVVWGSSAGPGGVITATMRVEHADPLHAEGPRRFAASLAVDRGSDRFELAFDVVYCAIAICL